MKRDLELIRKILLAIENSDSRKIDVIDLAKQIFQTDPSKPDFVNNAGLVSHHVQLLLDAEYIDAEPFAAMRIPYDQFSTE